jgi:hypothetical protein
LKIDESTRGYVGDTLSGRRLLITGLRAGSSKLIINKNSMKSVGELRKLVRENEGVLRFGDIKISYDVPGV